MKIAVTSTGTTLDDRVDPRFGRCPYFLVIDTETLEAETLENPNVALGGGAGIQSAQAMAQRDVKAVLTGNCGPN
ncbi:MAG TPA: NifB/NifX family molybdenum-iron cluster-binding protein, partial [bacterium]|nr:NifB/NifX family molybdenum-iron cluster-binding protein [bacterium]